MLKDPLIISLTTKPIVGTIIIDTNSNPITVVKSNLFNVFLFLCFVFVAFFILNYKYKSKPNEEEKKEKDKLKKTYILSKIKQLSDKRKTEYDKMITNLPKFESNFELLHKKFYNV